MQCIVDGCPKAAVLLPNGKPKHAGLCHGHAKRKHEGKPLGPLREYGIPPPKRLEKAAIELGNVDSEDDDGYRKALKRLSVAAVRLAKHKVKKSTNHPPRG
jgi:hypothetical protein